MRKFLALGIVVFGLPLALSAAEAKIVFSDPLKDKLAKGWTWIRKNPETQRITSEGLEIMVEPGVADTVKNALVRKVPARAGKKLAFEVTVVFTSAPIQQYEQAGITWYLGSKPVFKLVHELIDGKTYIIPGKKPTNTSKMQLRLVVSGDQFEAQYRPDCKGPYMTAATGKLPPGKNENVSIQCYNGPPRAKHWMRFSDFHILELAD